MKASRTKTRSPYGSGFGPMEWLYQLCRSVFWRALRRLGWTSPLLTLPSQQLDQIGEFDEYPPCEACGCPENDEVQRTRDGMRIVSCSRCGLWFTSPRIAETTWVEYLSRETDRSIAFTEGRLRYGAALPANIPFAPPFWRRLRGRARRRLLADLEAFLKRPIERLHDVGCGAGFLLDVARAEGIKASGNDLNGYACRVMRERLGLEVYQGAIPHVPIGDGTVDVVVMRDVIEHTYHPRKDLEAVCRILMDDGVLYIETFHLECRAFEKLKGDWNYLFWNHVFHFTRKSLVSLVSNAGFEVDEVRASRANPLIEVFARKKEALPESRFKPAPLAEAGPELGS